MKNKLSAYLSIGILFLCTFLSKDLKAQNNQSELQTLVTNGYNYLVSGQYPQAENELKKAYSIDPNQFVTSNLLANLYIITNQYNEAEKYAKIASRLGYGDKSAKDLLHKAHTLNTQNEASTWISYLIIILILCSIFPILINLSKSNKNIDSIKPSLTLIGLFGLSSVSILYFLFYAFSDWIWSQNVKVQPIELTPSVRDWLGQHDGYEGYILFLSSFIICGIAYLLYTKYFTLNSSSKPIFIIASLIASTLLIYNIKFFPPLTITTDYTFPIIKSNTSYIYYYVLVLLSIFLLIFADRTKSILVYLVGLGIMWVGCCINSQPNSEFDYNFITMPALRLFHGVSINDIYFQYDMFLSFIAYGFLLLKIPLHYFQLIGQYSYLIAAIGLFFISKKILIENKLPVLFLILIIIFRQNAIMVDPILCFQVSPIRLELWILLLLSTYFLGIHHWSNGLILGLLILFHRNFGLLYLAAYSIVHFTIYLSNIFHKSNNNSLSNIINNLISTFKDLFIKSYLSFGLIILSIGATIILFGGIYAESAVLYQKIGIGMLPILKNSFFWWIFVLFAVNFILLYSSKNIISDKYFNTALLLLALTISSSMYFFGRSHEHNIINIAAGILFIFIISIDLSLHLVKNRKSDLKTNSRKYNTILSIPYIVAFLLSIYYAPLIIDKFSQKLENYKKNGILFPEDTPDPNLVEIKNLTNNSDKVYFVDVYHDFHYYYYGGYKPESYYSPFAAWFYMKDMISGLNNLIDKGYYIVCIKTHHGIPGNNTREIAEIVPQLKYNKSIENNDLLIYWKAK